ncbi:HK97 family phage prohead protease [Sphaerisporangium sp. TRM90804]|uniref:HK97 family phage prohead protease n=1 Tax=Sphaerisporangium sp. TRM90804 TaxID=3031113 RepID=UPI00244BB67E|nr:HK97 family phage prohead protease [Sphaerisporangium sp. TRM90804]MDH2429326.1 HK97 family phage prohead protease [Sphaerisporangium sp. TRM90804]
MNTKSLRVEIKDADKGEVTAIFSTFNVKDSDGDVTLPGAFEDGAEMPISAYGHTSWSGALPPGKGRIRTTKTEAILEAQFFLDTQHGADTFKTVQRLGELGQWSYGYDVTKESRGEFEGKRARFLEGLKVHEVSPVLLGAGVGTRTLGAKSAPMSFAEEARAVLAAVSGLGDRAADVLAKRLEKGKGLGAESAELIEQVNAELKRYADLLADPEPDVDTSDLEREWLRMVARKHAKEKAA